MPSRRGAGGRFSAHARTPAEYRQAARGGRLSPAYAERMARALERAGRREASSDFRRRAIGHAPAAPTTNRYDRQRAHFLALASAHTGRSIADLASDTGFNGAFVRAFGRRDRWA